MRQSSGLRRKVLQLVLGTLTACGGPTGFAADPSDLPSQAARILDRYCHRCHRGAGSASGYEFDVRAATTMTAGDAAVVKPGSPTESPLWGLMHRGTMPPKSQIQLPRPTPAEAQVVADWIKAGSPAFPVAKPREFVSLEQTLRAIRDDLQKQADARTRRRLRYFTLVEMHNNPGVSDDSLALARAGLAKALNSLSWERELAIPRAVNLPQSRSTDASSVLRELDYAVDIEALGWNRDH